MTAKTTLPARHHNAATHVRAITATGILWLLSACASTAPPPDWQANAFAALGSYTSAYLSGNTRVADHEFERAKSEIARTGRTDLMARLELARCATQVASLDVSPCTAYTSFVMDAKPQEQAYAAFISGQWSELDPALLPANYQEWVVQALKTSAPGKYAESSTATSQAVSITPTSKLLSQIQDPLSRLIAAGSLLQREQLTPGDIALAVDTASNQGWRKPLLAWLGLQQKREQAADHTAVAANLQRRIDLVLQTQKNGIPTESPKTLK